ncbi:acyl-CoA N-acyltransferase [Nemania sp. NC0429]|nr:acyl-CoA N-acyltransferase [Nemania sp. NC0429]
MAVLPLPSSFLPSLKNYTHKLFCDARTEKISLIPLTTTKPPRTPPRPILQLGHSVIRPYSEDDVECLAKEANNPKIAQWMRNSFPHPYTTSDAEKWISITTTSASPLRDFAICRLDNTTAVIGGIGLKTRDDIHYRTMELGYWLGEDHWRRGIASEAVSAFAEWAFDHFEKLVRLEAEVFDGNAASARVLEKAGFELEGRRRMAVEKSGTVMDALVYCMFRRET